MSTVWQRLCPSPVAADAPIAPIARELARPETVAALQRHEDDGTRPTDVLARLDALDVAACFVDPERSSALHLGALNEVLARSSGSLAITVAVNALALLPVFVAAAPEQVRTVCAQVRAGSRAAILLTEWTHGSDLVQTETVAEADGDGWRLHGEKHLINGGRTHDLLVVLARAAPGGLTMFLAERDPTVAALPPWRTLPTAGADISGVRFAETVAQPLGRVGDGLGVLQKTLAISRGGVSALAAGTAAAAREQATAYARSRRLYGAPIAALGAIGTHLARLYALEALTAALSVKQAVLVNHLGPGATGHTTMAKFVCCALAEEAVTEGRRVLGARALLRGQPYERLIRDVLLYGVFDGTSHVVLDRIAFRMAQVAARPPTDEDVFSRLAEAYGSPPRPLQEVARKSARPWIPDPAAWLWALAGRPGGTGWVPVAALAERLIATTRQLRASGRWDQGVQHAVAEVYAGIEALGALHELSDGEIRAAFGAVPLPDDGGLHTAVVRYARGWYGGRLCAGLEAIVRTAGLAMDLEPIARALGSDHEAAGSDLRRLLLEPNLEGS